MKSKLPDERLHYKSFEFKDHRGLVTFEIILIEGLFKIADETLISNK